MSDGAGEADSSILDNSYREFSYTAVKRAAVCNLFVSVTHLIDKNDPNPEC